MSENSNTTPTPSPLKSTSASSPSTAAASNPPQRQDREKQFEQLSGEMFSNLTASLSGEMDGISTYII